MVSMDGTRLLHDRTELWAVLSPVLDRVMAAAPGFRYRLVGTGAALAQGVDLTAGDIDVLVTERDEVDAFAEALSGFPCLAPPAWLPESAQYFTHFSVDGVDVGASTVEAPVDTDTFECAGSGPWRHHVDVVGGRHTVPAVALELRLVSELVRERPDRQDALIRHLRARAAGVDLDLVRRSMADRGVDPATRRWVLDRLRP